MKINRLYLCSVLIAIIALIHTLNSNIPGLLALLQSTFCVPGKTGNENRACILPSRAGAAGPTSANTSQWGKFCSLIALSGLRGKIMCNSAHLYKFPWNTAFSWCYPISYLWTKTLVVTQDPTKQLKGWRNYFGLTIWGKTIYCVREPWQ